MEQRRTQQRPSVFDDPRRVGGVAGIAFVVLFVVGAVVQGNSPNYGDSAQTIRTFFTNHAGQYATGEFITAVGVVFGLVPFGAALRSVLGRVDTSGGMWARLAFTGAILWTVLAGAGSVGFIALALTKGQGLDDSSLLLVAALGDIEFGLAGLGLGLLTGATAIVIWRTGVFWRWLAALGGVATVLTAVGDLVALHHGDMGVLDGVAGIGYVASLLFVLVLSVMMIVRKGDQEAAEAVAVTTAAPER